MLDKSTICAVSTALGVGGIAVIRVSGPEALPITLQLFRYREETPVAESVKPRYAYYGEVITGNKLIDEVTTIIIALSVIFIFL